MKYTTLKELYDLGFSDEIDSKPNGILNYHLIQEEDNELYLQVCIKNTDQQPILVSDQYDWDNMESNTTYTTFADVDDLSILIETLRKLFVVPSIQPQTGKPKPEPSRQNQFNSFICLITLTKRLSRE